MTRGKNLDDRDYLNTKLDELSKPIYIIIDDLDRCDSNINKKEEEIKKIQAKIEETENIISRIKENITISRKIVNYLKGIKRDINKLNNGIENISEEFLKEDWLEAIIKVQFVKNFMTEIFNNIKMSEDIYEFAQEHQAFPIDVVFDLHYDLLINNEKKETILNQLIYKIDTIDFDNISRESFINKIFELLCKRNSPFKVNTKEFLDFSKQFIACLKELGLTDQDRRLCVSGGNSILRKAIIDNFIDFRKVLSVLFDITIIENNFQTLDVYGVNEFYEKLKKIDKNSRFMGLESEIKLLSIKTYYENLQVELKNEKYKSIGVDF